MLPLQRYYTYGDEARFDQEIVDEMNLLVDRINEFAETRHHPYCRTYLARFNLLSAAEAQAVKSPSHITI